MAGEAIPNFYRGGLKEGLVKVSPYGAMVGEAARKHADDVKAKLLAGTYVIFKGCLLYTSSQRMYCQTSRSVQFDSGNTRIDSPGAMRQL